MSSAEPAPADPPADGPSQTPAKKDRHEGHKHTKRNYFTKHGKKASEEAPLIANDALDQDEADDADLAEEPPAQQQPRKGKLASLTKLGRWLWTHLMVICILILLIAGIIALAIYFAVFYNQDDEKPSSVSSICLTPACVIAASNIIDNMSPNYAELDPCVDFDKFVCDGFNERHDLRSDQGALFTPTIMAENAQQILRHVLESPYSTEIGIFEAHSSARQEVFTKLKAAYDSCMDEDQVKVIGSAPLLLILKKVEALFPAAKPHKSSAGFHKMLDEAQKGLVLGGEDKLPRTVAYLHEIGVTAILAIGVGADDKDPDVTIVSVNAPRQPGLPSKEYYKDPELVVRYAQVIGEVLEALLYEAERPNATVISFSAGRPVTRSADLVEQLVTFESKLAKLTPNTEDAEDVTKYYNPMTLEETSKLLPQLPISYLVSQFASSGCKPTKLIIGSPSYLEGVSEVLKTTSTETLQAYFVWKTVQAYAYQIEDDAVKPLKRFNNELQGKDPDANEERWRKCIKIVDNGLGWILSKFYVEKVFSKEAKKFGDRIISDIKAQFIKKLGAAEWMSKDVQDLGIEKVHNIVQKIGYPTKSPDIRNASDLKMYYETVNITRGSFFNNALSVSQFYTRREWSALCKPTDRDEWGMTANTVNAYYNPAGNEIVFPAGIMQAPVFYDPSLPQYLSYGAFGSVSGHELSHAFDSSGRHYDETGNFTDWWDDDTVEAFKDKAQCFVNQYHEFTVPNPNGDPLHVNGRLTLGENLADAGGLSAAFEAWKDSDTIKSGKLLPGLQNFTKEQVFFISYSNFWCGKIRPETAVSLIYRDPHAPTRARILGTMANSRGFREAFSCPSKEPTCELW